MGKKNSVLYQSSGWTSIAAKRQTHHTINKIVPITRAKKTVEGGSGSFCFRWNDRQGDFVPENENGEPYPRLLREEGAVFFKVQKMVERIRRRSRIRRLPIKTLSLLFLMTCLGGFIGAYFLITSGKTALGNAAIIFICLAAFFIFFGYTTYLGSQMDRVSSFFKDFNPKVSFIVGEIEYSYIINHSFYFTRKLRNLYNLGCRHEDQKSIWMQKREEKFIRGITFLPN